MWNAAMQVHFPLLSVYDIYISYRLENIQALASSHIPSRMWSIIKVNVNNTLNLVSKCVNYNSIRWIMVNLLLFGEEVGLLIPLQSWER